jgi:hypothetical protein
MKFVKIVGLAFAAAFVLGMVASASASAASIGIFECEAKTGGKYEDSACLKEVSSGGKFEEKEIGGATYTSKAIGTTVLATAAKEVKCTGATNEGVITNRTEGRATIKFTGCKEGSGNNCSTSGTGSEIVTAVSSKIVTYTETTLKAGLLLAPRNASGANETVFKCAGTEVKVYGSVIGAVTPESEMSQSATVKFVVSGGAQKIPETTNSLRAKFASGATEKATQEGEALLDFTLKVEVMG